MSDKIHRIKRLKGVGMKGVAAALSSGEVEIVFFAKDMKALKKGFESFNLELDAAKCGETMMVCTQEGYP